MNTKEQLPFYSIELPESAKEEIRVKYGRRKVSENIISMFNQHLQFRVKRNKRIYDYEVIEADFFRKVVKDAKIKKPEVLGMFMEERLFRDGTSFRHGKFKNKKKEAKHFRFTSDFIRTHGFDIKLIFIPVETIDEGYSPSYVEANTNLSIDKVSVTLDLLNMTISDIENELSFPSRERFNRKVTIKDNTVFGDNKRYDFELSYHLKDHELYEFWETKLGAFRMFNSLVQLIYGNRLSQISTTNDRLDHRLLQVPKECLSLIRVDNEPLVELDLKNSQPCLLMNALFGKFEIPFDDFQLMLKTTSKKYETLEKLIITNRNYSDLIESSFNGTFYETLQTLSSPIISRKESKQATMFILFSAFDAKWNPSKKTWQDNFPELLYFLTAIKQSYFKAHRSNDLTKPLLRSKRTKASSREASNAFLAISLQRLEALIFVEHILKDLYQNEIFSLTKHDAVLCKQSEVEKVRGIMEKHLDHLLGKGKYTLEENNLFKNNKTIAA